MTWIIKRRINDIEFFMKYPHDVQRGLMAQLIDTAKDTEYGKLYHYKSIDSLADFKDRVPIVDYESLFPYIERLMKGEKNLLWPTSTEWFAKSSGTTNARSKFIPVTPEALEGCHYKCGKDMVSLYVNNFPNKDLFAGKWLSIGGSHQISQLNEKTYYGDVSAILMQNLPLWARFIRTPSLKTALLDQWEHKIDKMVDETRSVDVTSLAGVPTWTLVLIRKMLELAEVDDLLEVWPNLEIYVHGAVAFGPYRDLFKGLISGDQVSYLETYNASEGFIAIQDQPNSEDLLLMLDYGIYYEFMPLDQLEEEHPATLSLDEVETGKHYAVVISTTSGLWRYMIGDTIKFTSLDPYRIKVTGRTKHFINAFGEEVIIENADQAIEEACRKSGALVSDYTACPVYFDSSGNGGHEWLIEFEKDPSDIELFCNTLDQHLREINSDYDAKRYMDIAMTPPKINVMPKGTFYNWMESKGKLGGQHKVPRLSNNREYLEEVLDFTKSVSL